MVPSFLRRLLWVTSLRVCHPMCQSSSPGRTIHLSQYRPRSLHRPSLLLYALTRCQIVQRLPISAHWHSYRQRWRANPKAALYLLHLGLPCRIDLKISMPPWGLWYTVFTSHTCLWEFYLRCIYRHSSHGRRLYTYSNYYFNVRWRLVHFRSHLYGNFTIISASTGVASTPGSGCKQSTTTVLSTVLVTRTSTITSCPAIVTPCFAGYLTESIYTTSTLRTIFSCKGSRPIKLGNMLSGHLRRLWLTETCRRFVRRGKVRLDLLRLLRHYGREEYTGRVGPGLRYLRRQLLIYLQVYIMRIMSRR